MLTSRQCHAQGRHWRWSRWPRSGCIGCLARLCEVSSFPQSHLAFSHLLDHLRRHLFCHYRSRFLLATFRSHTPTRARLPRRASIVTGTDRCIPDTEREGEGLVVRQSIRPGDGLLGSFHLCCNGHCRSQPIFDYSAKDCASSCIRPRIYTCRCHCQFGIRRKRPYEGQWTMGDCQDS